jgi:hypothetical protein
VFSKIVIELIDILGLVWFPAVGPSMMIATMCYNLSDYEFILVLIEYKGSQIVNMSIDLFALN